MRDLGNQEKADNARVQKQNEKMNSEITALQKDKERLGGDVQTLNEQMIELQEQVSAHYYIPTQKYWPTELKLH